MRQKESCGFLLHGKRKDWIFMAKILKKEKRPLDLHCGEFFMYRKNSQSENDAIRLDVCYGYASVIEHSKNITMMAKYLGADDLMVRVKINGTDFLPFVSLDQLEESVQNWFSM